MNIDFELDLSEKVNALPLSDEDKKRVIDIVFWAMEQVAKPKPATEGAAEPTERLDEHDRAEWFDVARRMCPGLSEAEYDSMWDEFQQAKADHERQKGLQ